MTTRPIARGDALFFVVIVLLLQALACDIMIQPRMTPAVGTSSASVGPSRQR
jgi:hypothetical protein